MYPGSDRVFLLGLHGDSDQKIWQFAREHEFSIVTQDSDFYERSLIFGIPPKIIWLRAGNISTQNIKRLLKQHSKEIILFEKDKVLGCLQIY